MIQLQKTTIHILDNDADIPVLNSREIILNTVTEDFFTKILKKTLRNKFLRKAKFNNYKGNAIRTIADKMIYEEEYFINGSHEIASKLYKVMEKSFSLDSNDLAVVRFFYNEETYIGIIKLDYSNSLGHETTFNNETQEVEVKVIENKVSFKPNQKVEHAAIFKVSSLNSEYDLFVLDEEAEKNQVESEFIKEFLDCFTIMDSSYLTKNFLNILKNWSDLRNIDILDSEYFKGYYKNVFLEKHIFDLDSFLEESPLEEDDKEDFKFLVDNYGFPSEFEIDNTEAEKMLKNRKIKTDTGFEVKAKDEMFSDSILYTINKNNDETFNIIIKNVYKIEEK